MIRELTDGGVCNNIGLSQSGSLHAIRRQYPCHPADTVPVHILRGAAHPGHLQDLRAVILRAHDPVLVPDVQIRLVGRVPTPHRVTAADRASAALCLLIGLRVAHQENRHHSRCIARG